MTCINDSPASRPLLLRRLGMYIKDVVKIQIKKSTAILAKESTSTGMMVCFAISAASKSLNLLVNKYMYQQLDGASNDN